MTSAEHVQDDEIIENGAVITLEYDEYNTGDVYFNLNTTSSSQYANIQEWFYGEDIGAKIILQEPSFDLNRIFFMRGVLKVDSDGSANYLQYDADGYMTMVIESQNTQTSTKWVKVRANTTLFQSDGDSRIIFETEPIDINSDIYYEVGRTYPIDANGNHLGFDGSDTDQTDIVDAELISPLFTCYAWGNSHESHKIKDEFNSKALNLDTRPSTTIDDYRENNRISSLTYSQPYEQSINYNGLNEFNLSLINYLDLDDSYGNINKIKSFNTDLDVWQEDKVHRVLYKKSVLYNKDGSTNLSKSDEILGGIVSYDGEYGIGNHPESMAVHNSDIYWTDDKRGVVLKKDSSGISIISELGMESWFRNIFKGTITTAIGGYNPYFNQYIIGINKTYTLAFDEKIKGWVSFYSYTPDTISRLNNNLYTSYNGELYLHNSDTSDRNTFYNSFSDSIVETVINDKPSDTKLFKSLTLEGSSAWGVVYTTNLTNGTIDESEFVNKEDEWYAYIRRSEDVSDISSMAVQGVGEITSVSGVIIGFDYVNEFVNDGDTLYYVDSGVTYDIGVIASHTTTSITVTSVNNVPTVGEVSICYKNNRIEGSSARGYYLNLNMTLSNVDRDELFAVNVDTAKSFQ